MYATGLHWLLVNMGSGYDMVSSDNKSLHEPMLVKVYDVTMPLLWLNSLDRVTHMYASVIYSIIGSDNGLSPVRRHAIISADAGILLIGTILSEISNENMHFHSRKCILKYRLQNGGHFVSTSMC